MPDSGGHRSGGGPYGRGREITLNERDEVILTLALTDKFPAMTFTSEHREMYGGNRPCSSIATSDSSIVWARVDRQWSPDFYLHICRSHWDWGETWSGPRQWAFDPPTLTGGSIGSSHMEGDAISRGFIQTVWRILRRIATNRVQHGNALYRQVNGSERCLMSDVKAGDFWYGHQALAWTLEGGDRRMLNGSARPCDDWQIPNDRWYQEIMRRAMDTEGWNAKTLPGTNTGESYV